MTTFLDKAMVGDQRRRESRRYSQHSNLNLISLSEVQLYKHRALLLRPAARGSGQRAAFVVAGHYPNCRPSAARMVSSPHS